MYIHFFIPCCDYLLTLGPALYSAGWGAIVRVWQHWPASSVELKNEWSYASDPPYSLLLFSGKSVPLPHLPNPHSLPLVLFCYIYYLKYTNFEATWTDFSRSMIVTT